MREYVTLRLTVYGHGLWGAFSRKLRPIPVRFVQTRRKCIENWSNDPDSNAQIRRAILMVTKNINNRSRGAQSWRRLVRCLPPTVIDNDLEQSWWLLLSRWGNRFFSGDFMPQQIAASLFMTGERSVDRGQSVTSPIWLQTSSSPRSVDMSRRATEYLSSSESVAPPFRSAYAFNRMRVYVSGLFPPRSWLCPERNSLLFA